MADQTKTQNLWTPRSVEETQKIYADWADTYEADVGALNYATPDRIASALAQADVVTDTGILDFGCGTGLSGVALARQGFTCIDGVDISAEMLAHARGKDVYRSLTLGTPGQLDIAQGAYPVIVAAGVISLGAAPPDMLHLLLDKLPTGGLIAFSYNDPTLADDSYMAALDTALKTTADLVFREHGPHLDTTVTGSDVILLRRR